MASPSGSAADDRSAIERLLYLYAERVDAGDFAGVGELFEAAAFRSDQGGQVSSAEGPAAVQRQFETMVRRYDDGTPRTKHVTTNVIIELDGDTATSRSYYTVFQQPPGQALHTLITGRYHDRFERTGDGWRFTDRLVYTDLIGDLSHHLTIELGFDPKGNLSDRS